MRPFLIINFVYVFLILTASYVIDFILKCFDLAEPKSKDEITAAIVIRFAYLAVLTITWLWFRFSWKRKYEASLNPQEQAAASHGREMGKRIGFVILLVSIGFMLAKYFFKM